MKGIIYLMLFIVLATINNNILAQTTYGKTIQLNSNIVGNQDYIARDWIDLQAGFSFTPTATTDFSASIDEYQICNSDYIAAPDPMNRTLNKGLPVGTIEGNFEVDEYGAGTYEIPITMPPGTKGVVPSLSIALTTNNDNGLLGKNADLAGLSKIQRIGKTILHDGLNEGITFSDDRFAIDGNRLMLNSGNYGEDGAIYFTEIGGYDKIISYGNSGNGPSYFILKNKDGYILEYGNSDDSRIEATGRSEVSEWLLYKITDKNGNYILYHYDENTIDGSYKPSYIEYTGNSNTGLNPYNRIEFLYEERDDRHFGYIAGSKIVKRYLLRMIRTKAENKIVNIYKFKYSKSTEDSYSKLVEITQGDETGNFNSTVFAYGTAPEQLQTKTPANNIEAEYSGDFNGDGFADLVTFKGGLNIYLNDKQGNFNFVCNKSLASLIIQGSVINLPKVEQVFVRDINMDGKDDIFCSISGIGNGSFQKESDYILINSANWSNLDIRPFKNYVAGTPLTSDFIHQVGDFNGDYKMDVLTFLYNTDSQDYNISISSFDFELDRLKWYAGINVPAEAIQVYDYNGDGSNDICAIYGTTGKFYKVAGSTIVPISLGINYFNTTNVIFPGDFNGDRIQDLLIFRIIDGK